MNDVFDDATIDEIDRKGKPAAPPATVPAVKATVSTATTGPVMNPYDLYLQRG